MKRDLPSAKLHYNWLWYGAVLLIAITWWVLAFQMYHIPQNADKVTIFYAGQVTDRSLAGELEQIYGIRLVELYSSDPEAWEFQTKYSVVGLNTSSILLIPASVAEKTYCAESFVPLQQLGVTCQEPFIQQDAQTKEMVAFGIPADPTVLSRYFDEATGYYLFVGGKGVDEEGKPYPHTLQVLRYLTGG